MPCTRRIASWSFLALLAVASWLPSTQAQSWSGEEREIDFEADARSFRFVSVRPDHDDEERITGAFDLVQARFVWGFQANASAPTRESAARFAALVEWRDADGDETLGVGDEVVRRQEIADLANASLDVLPQPTGGRTVHATYPFPGESAGPLDPLTGRRLSGGGITLSFRLLGESTAFAGGPADPAAVPVDVRIENWPSSRNDSRLALELDVRSVGAMRISGEAWIATHEGAEHDLAWAKTHTRNGSVQASRIGALERPGTQGLGEEDAMITLLASYDQGNVLHSFSFGTDPRAQAMPDLGGAARAFLGDSRLYLAGVAACGLFVGLTAARKMRRRD